MMKALQSSRTSFSINSRGRPRLRSASCQAQPSHVVSTRRILLTVGGANLGLVDFWRDQAQAAGNLESIEIEQGARKVVPVTASILVLRNSIPSSWTADFQRLAGNHNKLKVKTEKSLHALFKSLQATRGKGYDLVSIGDAWLAAAVERNLVLPFLDPERYRWFGALSKRWKTLLTRDTHGFPCPSGHLWGVPYRWGCTIIAYREDKLKKIGLRRLNDWSDLLHPKLKRRVAFIDSPREFVGIALKSLGLGYNDQMEDLHRLGLSESTLRERVHKFQDQTLLFSNTDHVRALVAEDAWIAVGSSSDLLPLAGAISKINFCIPQSGTALWSDLFVIPSSCDDPEVLGTSPLINPWLDFVLASARTHGGGLQAGVVPLDLPPESSSLSTSSKVDGELDAKGRFLPSDQVLSISEFLLPLDHDTLELYKRVLQPR